MILQCLHNFIYIYHIYHSLDPTPSKSLSRGSFHCNCTARQYYSNACEALMLLCYKLTKDPTTQAVSKGSCNTSSGQRIMPHKQLTNNLATQAQLRNDPATQAVNKLSCNTSAVDKGSCNYTSAVDKGSCNSSSRQRILQHKRS